MNMYYVIATVLRLVLLVSTFFGVGLLIDGRKRHDEVITDTSDAAKRLLTPVVVSIIMTLGFATFLAGSYANEIESIKPTDKNITKKTEKFDVLPVSSAYPQMDLKHKDTDYLAEGNRTQYHSDSSRYDETMLDLKPTKVNQFIMKTKKGKNITVETSGNAVKIIKDLDPKGSTKPYYQAMTCSWKNSNVTKACPIQKLELHLYSNSTTHDGILTQRPANINDDVNDPLIAKQTNPNDDSGLFGNMQKGAQDTANQISN